MEGIGYVATFAMGITLGLMGGGGSILTVPILVYLFGLSPTVATGHSLFVVGVTALIGSFLYIRKGDVDFKTALAFAIPSILGVNFSRGFVIPKIPSIVFSFGNFSLTKEVLVMATFSILMIVASYSMITKRKERKAVDAVPILRFGILAFEGLIVGIIAGFVGAGGGFLIVPALVLFAGLTMKVAVGTSLLIIAFQSLFGFGGDLSRGNLVDWPLLTVIAFIAILGIVVGTQLAAKTNEKILKPAFGWFVLLMGATILAQQIGHLSYK